MSGRDDAKGGRNIGTRHMGKKRRCEKKAEEIMHSQGMLLPTLTVVGSVRAVCRGGIPEAGRLDRPCSWKEIHSKNKGDNSEKKSREGAGSRADSRSAQAVPGEKAGGHLALTPLDA